MTYARLQDDFPENPKVAGLSDSAFRLYVTGLCYAARNKTNGAIPRGILRRLGGSTTSAERLVAARLWENTEAGWTIHDYLKHQRSREEIESISQAKRQAGALGGAASVVARGLKQKGTQLQIQSTDTDQKNLTARALYEQFVGKSAPPTLNTTFGNLEAAHPSECLRWGFELAADKDDPWAYAKRVFNSCGGMEMKGHGPRGLNGAKPVRRTPPKAVGAADSEEDDGW